MKRFAWLALAIVIAFLGATFVDRCSDGASDDCPPTCHVACVDGCAVAPLATAAPVAVALVGVGDHRRELASTPLDRNVPPHFIPPRA